jgi:hypothetical protein
MMSDETPVTVEQIESVVERVITRHMADAVTQADLDKLRDEMRQEMNARVDAQQQALAGEYKAALSSSKGELTDFVNTMTVKTEGQLRELSQQFKALAEAVKANRALEDARDMAQQQLANNVHSNTQAVQAAQALGTANQSGIARMEGEISDIYHRVKPLVYEVMGNAETGKLSLRQEWDRQHRGVMDKLVAIESGMHTYGQRVAVAEDTLQDIYKRHAAEDVLLREWPRRLKNAATHAVVNMAASAVIRWIVILGGGSALAALAYEVLRNLGIVIQ